MWIQQGKYIKYKNLYSIYIYEGLDELHVDYLGLACKLGTSRGFNKIIRNILIKPYMLFYFANS